MKIILILILFIPQISLAETWLELHITSHHDTQTYNQDRPDTKTVIYDETESHKYNENNYGFGIAYESTNHIELIAGGYRNSYDKNSLYAGADLHTRKLFNIRAGISAGLISGYEDSNFMVLPNLTFDQSGARIKIGYTPGIGDTSGFATFSVGVIF